MSKRLQVVLEDSELTSSDKIWARDALHVAIMRRNGIGKILSFDAGFDGIAGILRVFH
jgi:predicted nucleic acid-binding protein